MKTLLSLVGAAALGLSASGQSSSPTPDNWGPTQQGVRVSLSLDKTTYTVGETIQLSIKAQVVSAGHPVYDIPDRPTGAFNIKIWHFLQELSI